MAKSKQNQTSVSPKLPLHEISIPNGSWTMLDHVVRSPGWAKGEKLYRRSMRLRRALPKLDQPTGSDAKLDAWAGECRTVRMRERERETAKRCLQHFLDAGAFSSTEHVDELLAAFGVLDDPEDLESAED